MVRVLKLSSIVFIVLFSVGCALKVVRDERVLNQMIVSKYSDENLKILSINDIEDGSGLPIKFIQFSDDGYVVLHLRITGDIELCGGNVFRYVHPDFPSFNTELLGVGILRQTILGPFIVLAVKKMENSILILDDNLKPVLYRNRFRGKFVHLKGASLLNKYNPGEGVVLGSYGIVYYLDGSYKYPLKDTPLSGCSWFLEAEPYKYSKDRFIYPVLCHRTGPISAYKEIYFAEFDYNLNFHDIIAKVKDEDSDGRPTVLRIKGTNSFAIVHRYELLGREKYVLFEVNLYDGSYKKILQLEDIIPLDVKFSDGGRYVGLIALRRDSPSSLSPFIYVFDLYKGEQIFTKRLSIKPYDIKAFGFVDHYLVFLAKEKFFVLDPNTNSITNVNIFNKATFNMDYFDDNCIADVSISPDKKWVALPYGANLILIKVDYLKALLRAL